MDSNERIFKGRCAQLVKDYGDILEIVVDKELKALRDDGTLGNTTFEVLKDAIYTAGLREGMKRIIAKINKYGRESGAN